MASFIDQIIPFVQKNAVIIIVAIILIAIIIFIVTRPRKKDLRPISVSEVVRKSFVERNKLNYTGYKWLFRGKELLGKISKLRYTDLSTEKNNNKEDSDPVIPAVEMVVRPVAVNFGWIRILNPFAKELCITVRFKSIRIDRAISEIEIDEKITFDKIFGIFYDRAYEKEIVEHIKTTSLFRENWDTFASVFYVKSMEQATFNPVDATAVQMKQMDLEIEKQKRAKLVS